jgi:hypothetical protein
MRDYRALGDRYHAAHVLLHPIVANGLQIHCQPGALIASISPKSRLRGSRTSRRHCPNLPWIPEVAPLPVNNRSNLVVPEQKVCRAGIALNEQTRWMGAFRSSQSIPKVMRDRDSRENRPSAS